jgi:anti-sigma B factor antagonist
MAITIDAGAKGRHKAVIEGNMTIYEAAADKLVLLGALAKAKELEIDLSSLREMDTAGLQILILLKRESLRAGKVMRLVGESPASRNVLDTYNMAAYFAAPIASSAKQKNKACALRQVANRP